MIWAAAGIVLLSGLVLLLRWRNRKKQATALTLPEVRTEPQPIPFTPIKKKPQDMKSRHKSFPLRQKLKRTGAIVGG